MAKTVLLIDDDAKLTQLLKQYLTQYGIDVVAAAHPNDGLALLAAASPSLVILDVMLPEKNGFEVCQEIRKTSAVPIIMLTARGDVADRIVGLELGADDYLSKPFEPRELLARIQSVLRRSDSKPTPAAKAYEYGDLRIDVQKRTAAVNGIALELTTMEFEVLLLFASKAGEVLTRDQIMDNLKGVDWEAYNRSIDVLISRLRQKLGDDPKHPRYLKTIWGTGYLFLGGT